MARDDEEFLAIIAGVGFGLRDTNRVVLWFEAHMLHGSTLQVLELDEAARALKEGDVTDIRLLEGKPCVLVRKEGGLTLFSRFWRVP